MIKHNRRPAVSVFFVCLLVWVFATNSFAISIQKEEEMGQEFMRVVMEHYEVIDDPQISDYLNKVGQHLVSFFPNQNFHYHFYIINEPEFNAFAAPAGHVFVYSGLFMAMDNEDELAGILAHEIAHVECRHISQKVAQSSKISMLTLAGIAAGIFLGVGGADSAAQGLMLGSIAAGQTMELAYSREDELQADQLGLKYLYKAGYAADGLLKMLEKIRNTEWFGSDLYPTYLRTHPAVEDRIAYIGSWSQRNKPEPGKTPFSPDEFKAANIRLSALCGEVKATMDRFQRDLAKNPDDPTALYGMGLLYDRLENRKKAMEYLKNALSKSPLDPYMLADLGRIYFLNGQYPEALNALKEAIYIIPDNSQALFFLGRTQLELGELTKSADVLEKLIQKKPQYPMGHYFLGETYGKLGELGDAHYHLGQHYMSKGDERNAVFHLEKALRLIQDPVKLEKIREMLKETEPYGKRPPRRSLQYRPIPDAPG
jgi:beta-barrel assembly-enhancing protease